MGKSLYLFYYILLLASIFFCLRILYIQFIWKGDPEVDKALSQNVKPMTIPQQRGRILACDGRPLALSYPLYNIAMDCTAKKKGKKYEKASPKQRDSIDNKWKADARILAQGLEEAYFPDGKSADYYYHKMLKGFDEKKQYIQFGKPLEREKYLKLLEYPLICEGRFKGGVWGEEIPTRKYPYYPAAQQTIGWVREKDEGWSYRGIEGKYDYILHGEEGHFYTKETDYGYMRDYDSLYVDAIDGKDVRTTINIDYQNIVDKALRKALEADDNLEAGCCVLMEVKTGKVRAIANMSRNAKGQVGEFENVAVTRIGEPGSVFKITTLMTAIEDGIVTSIDQTIPGNHGKLPGYENQIDKHILDYEKKYHSEQIPIRYCVQVSSNYGFRYLALENYSDHPADFVDKLYQYQLGTSFEFDTAEKITTPSIKHPNDSDWSIRDLGQLAMGYAANVTAMHLTMFYNAIANGGKMMKPYLVESIESDGKVEKTFSPSVQSQSICAPKTAAMITEAMASVTEDGGTGWRLKKAPCKVVGKTGTANIWQNDVKGYKDPQGRRKQLSSFAGFFPMEDPQYTIVCSTYTYNTMKDYFGGVIPTQVVLETIKEIYNIDPYWNESF